MIRLSVGPELFYVFLRVLKETGYFNASLYTPYSIVGIETLGYELALQTREQTERFSDVVIATHAGGGNVTGTARGLHEFTTVYPVRVLNPFGAGKGRTTPPGTGGEVSRCARCPAAVKAGR